MGPDTLHDCDCHFSVGYCRPAARGSSSKLIIAGMIKTSCDVQSHPKLQASLAVFMISSQFLLKLMLTHADTQHVLQEITIQQCPQCTHLICSHICICKSFYKEREGNEDDESWALGSELSERSEDENSHGDSQVFLSLGEVFGYRLDTRSR